MIHAKSNSLVGAAYKIYFENGSLNPAGDLVNAGFGLSVRHMNWWDTRSVWSYPYYSAVILLGDGIGFYRNENEFQCELAYGNLLITFPHLKQRYGPEKDQNWGEIYTGFDGEIFRITEKQNIINSAQPVWKLADPQTCVRQLQELLQAPLTFNSGTKFSAGGFFPVSPHENAGDRRTGTGKCHCRGLVCSRLSNGYRRPAS